MNQIKVYFSQCNPPPSGGYKIYYKAVGSLDYSYAGMFFISPAIFYDTVNPPGTCYDGFIQSFCGGVVGNSVAFETCASDSGGGIVPDISFQSVLCRSDGNCNDNSTCGMRFSIATDNAPIGSYITVNQTSGSATISIYDDDPANGILQYVEPNGFGTVTFDLYLRDSGGSVIASQPNVNISHQSYFTFISLCT